MAIEDSGHEAGSATHPLLPDYPSAGGFATPAMLAAQRTPVATVDAVTQVS